MYWIEVTTLLTIFYVNQIYGANFSQRPYLDGRIVGGETINIDEVPYQVSLLRQSHFCGGSLIAKNAVLTAAHCTAGRMPDDIRVRIGSTFNTKGGTIVNVKEIYRHEKYDPSTIDYDFSILILADYNPTNMTYGVIMLPKQNENVEDGTLLRVSGWGNTHNTNESSVALRLASVPKVNQKSCKKAYRRFGGVTDRMICAGFLEGGKDACQGDSGGPLVDSNKLVGVVSWGYGCAMKDYPGVYSRVAVVRNWIFLKSGI